MRYLPQMLGWLVLIVATVFLAVARRPEARDPTTISSILTYPLDEPVRFTLEPGETEVLLRTWLERPVGPWPGDLRLVDRWCLDLAVTDPDGATLRAWRAWTASRTSEAVGEDGRLRPRAWTSDPATLVSVDRATRVDLRGLVPRGGVLTATAGCLAPGARVLAVAARLGERSLPAQLRLEEGDGAAIRAAASDRVGASGWTDLPASWRELLLTQVWERLGALPPPDGGVNRTVRLSVSVDDPAPDDALGILLPPGGAAAWNLRGPVSFSGTWAHPDGAPAPAPRATARAVHSDGTVEALPIGPDGALGPWRFDDPLVSVQVALAPGEAPRRVRAATARAAQDPAWGDPPRRETAPGRYLADPELVTLEMARVDAASVRYHVASGERLRLLFRVPLPPAALTGFPPEPAAPAALDRPAPAAHETVASDGVNIPCLPEDAACVTVDILDAADAVLATHALGLAPTPSPFERYVLAGNPATAAVGDAGARVFVLPEGAAAVVVASTTPVDVSARVTAGDAGAVLDEPGYDLPPEANLRRRYAPLDREGWRARSPEDYDALAFAGRIARIDAQVRLEPGDPGPPDAPDDAESARVSTWHALPLPGPYELVGEPDPDAPPGAPPRPGAHVRLGAAPVSVTVPADGRLAVAYRVGPEHVGDYVVFTVDGATHARRLPTAADVLEIGPLPPGPARVQVDTPGLFLARGAGVPAWQVRRVWAARTGEEWTVTVPPGEGALRVHAYVAPGDGGWLGWQVEPAATTPPGPYAALTERSGVTMISAPTGASPASPLTFLVDGLRRALPVTVRFSEDLVAGGTVRFTIQGNRSPVWLRATATFPTPEAAPIARHARRGAPR